MPKARSLLDLGERPSDDAVDLIRELGREGIAEVDGGSRRRAEYSSDASNYRIVPEVVVFPRDGDEIAAAIEVARRRGVAVTMRGGGTSVAGNAIGPGMLLDTSRFMNRVLDLDVGERLARVEPGTVLGSLQAAAAPAGLRFGPDPSTWARCTIGGMIGNNACGPRALAFGRTADNVVELEVVDGSGRRFATGPGSDPLPEVDALVSANLDVIRTESGRFGRQISGYSLEHLLPENGRDLAKALVGTEGTCVAVLGATVRLVPVPAATALVVLGYADMASAADAVPALLPHRPTAIEGLDARLVDAVRVHRGEARVPALPRGAGWLLVEVAGDSAGAALERARRIVRDADALEARVLPHGEESLAIMRIREDGAGLAGRTPDGRQAWPGLEDAAVPPERLGDYLRDFDALTRRYGVQGMPYGHFGDGCVHVRLDIPLDLDGTVLRAFMEEAAVLIASHGGSLSGEHGDGRARSELLHRMYSPRMLELFGAFKSIFDPADIMNPGIVVRPVPLDQALRRPAARSMPAARGFAFVHDRGDVGEALHRCVGVGKCRADTSSAGGFMCPSYLATRDEKDSTRGRARVLQEMINGTMVKDWRSPEVHEALDLCLSCKACSSDCPAGVDMAAYKSEALHRSYRNRLRPIAHYTLGWMPRWARLATATAPRLLNALLGIRWLERLVLVLGGMDARRRIPSFAPRPFRAIAAAPSRSPEGEARKRVLLWVDTFSDNFSPTIPIAAIEVLESAGYEVLVPRRPVCCGLTWISTGQLDGARRRLRALLDELGPYAQEGIPIVGLEPSCTGVLRSDLAELLPDDPRTPVLAAGTYTLAELLSAPEPVGPGAAWTPPDLGDVTVLAQPHCHHHSVMGFDTDRALLARLGASSEILSGCCGLAGNFGMERGHYDVSVAVAERALVPALEAMAPGTVLLADGLSCRTQADQLGGVAGVHLAELLAQQMRRRG